MVPSDERFPRSGQPAAPPDRPDRQRFVGHALDRAGTWVIGIGVALALGLLVLFVATELGLLGFGAKEGPGSRTGSLSSTGVPAGPAGGSVGTTTGKTDTTGNTGAALGGTRSGESGR